MSKLKIYMFFLAIFVLFSSSTQAEAKLDREYVENFAKITLEQAIPVPAQGTLQIDVAEIDPRITIQDCDVPLTANIPENHNGRNVNVKISCEGSSAWQLYLAARISITVPVVTASTNISKGSMLDNNNLTISYIDQSSIRGEVFSELKDFIGAKSTRTLSRGAAISKSNICLVCKGESVTIQAESQGLLIKTEGIAMEDGVLGDEISIKNKNSGKFINARISAVGHVKVFL